MMPLNVREQCPKHGGDVTFDLEYVPKGDVRPFPYVVVQYLGSPYVAKGPCVMKTCRICGYTYTVAPADGEGNLEVEIRDASKDVTRRAGGHRQDDPGEACGGASDQPYRDF